MGCWGGGHEPPSPYAQAWAGKGGRGGSPPTARPTAGLHRHPWGGGLGEGGGLVPLTLLGGGCSPPPPFLLALLPTEEGWGLRDPNFNPPHTALEV